jgi:hypothetical protein
VAICNTCGKKYSKWTTLVGVKGVCDGCFQVELSNQDEGPQEEFTSFDLALLTQTKGGPIRFRSFLSRSRSPIVFALVMGSYSITLNSFLGAWARVAHLRRPTPPFYRRGDPADIISLLVIAPLAESLLLVGVFKLERRCHAPQTVQVFTAALFISALHIRPLVATRHYRLAVVLYSGGRVSVLASYLLEDGILRPDSDSRTRQSFSALSGAPAYTTRHLAA